MELYKSRAMEAPRIATLPEAELTNELAAGEKAETLATVSGLVKLARPSWFKASREKKHDDIKKKTKAIKRDAIGSPRFTSICGLRIITLFSRSDAAR